MASIQRSPSWTSRSACPARSFSDRAQRIAGDAAAHVLVADLARHHGAARRPCARGRHGELAQHVVLHVGQDFVVVLVLVMMGVDIDDQHVVEVALLRLLAGMGQEPRGVEFLDRYASAAISDEIHGVSPV